MDFENNVSAIIEKPKEERIPEEVLSMYFVPGYEREYTEHSLERYRRESEELDRDLTEAKEILHSGDFSNVEPEMARLIFAIADEKTVSPFLESVIKAVHSETLPSVEEPEMNISWKNAFSIIHESLIGGSYENLLILSEVIPYMDYSEREELETLLANKIRLGFETNVPDVMRECARAIWYSNEFDRTQLILNGFETGDSSTMSECAKAIECATEDDRTGLIIRGFETGDPDVMFECAGVIWHAKESDCGMLIKKGLETAEKMVIARCVDLIPSLPDSERLDLFEQARKIMGVAFVEGALYRNTKTGFSRESLRKDGSKTTLVGDFASSDLRGKVIIRHFDMRHFLEWKKLYDDFDFWKESGFEYVPIEPIVSFSKRKNGLIDVYSGVLDMSLEQWKQTSSEWKDALKKTKDGILSALQSIGFDHGHAHDRNFCLRFFRNEDGGIDYGKKPRLYLIDFEMAKFSRKTV